MPLSELVAAQRRADALERELSSEVARADAAEGALEAVTRQLAVAVLRERDDGVLEEKDEEIARLERRVEDLRDLPRIDEREVRRSAAIRVVSQPLLELETLDGLTDREIMSAVLESRGIAALMRSDAYVLGRFAAEVGRPWLAREDAGEFDEDLHPRAGDGKFGSGGGSAAGPKASPEASGGVMASIAERHKERIEKARAAAMAVAKTERKYEDRMMDGSVRTTVVPAASDKEAHAEGARAAKEEHDTIRGEEHRAEVLKENPHLAAAAKEQARITEEYSRNIGHDEETAKRHGAEAHEGAIRASVEEHDNNKADQDAIDAGHIKDDKSGQEFDKSASELESHIATTSKEMDTTARDALTALGKVNQLGEATEEGEVVDSPADAISDQLITAADTVKTPDGHGLGHGFDDLPGLDEVDASSPPEEPDPFDTPAPKERDYQDDHGLDEVAFSDAKEEHQRESDAHAREVTEYERGLAEWNRNEDKKKSEQMQHAKDAQAAFEKLQAQQMTALEDAKERSNNLDKIAEKAAAAYEWDGEDEKDLPLLNMKAFSKQKRAPENEDGDTFADPAVEDSFRKATAAAERIAAKRRQAIEDRTPNLDDHISSTKDAIKATASTIKQLARITGIKPTLSTAKPKKSSKK